ncbi:FAD-dependent oxidoreductase [Chromatiales bacterium (ex Bugula neritina AB1)]|nr:FAD-dependent oxidoreductase [Chromatiales bacterium (ex Bugula neritina AB1)]
MKNYPCDTAVIGAGIVGIATAYYLKKIDPARQVVLIDAGQPMELTSAQSGENYRNWWPHPVMTAFTDRSIDLMEEIATQTGNLINMKRRGYVLATRAENIDGLMDELQTGYAGLDSNVIRVHNNTVSRSYQRPHSAAWSTAPTGVDVLQNQQLIQTIFPSFDPAVQAVIHVRRAGDISAQQMGQVMLASFKEAGGVRVTGKVRSIDCHNGFTSQLDVRQTVQSQQIVNAAGPFINNIASMLGTRLPVSNTLQQKIAFEDTASAIPRDMPFSIDLDNQFIDWNTDEKALLDDDPAVAWLTREMPGSIHCRPDGGDQGRWIKLGWAFNNDTQEPVLNPVFSENFPEIVLRGAARLNPALKCYYDHMPRQLHHYGGYYTLTNENWPLIGEMAVAGSFVVGAMSGFGTMAACAAGELCALSVTGGALPDYAPMLSPVRYKNKALMEELKILSGRGIL